MKRKSRYETASAANNELLTTAVTSYGEGFLAHTQTPTHEVNRIKVAIDIGGRETDAVPDATRLTVIESDYYGTGKVPWNGIVVMKHRWYVER